MAYRSQQPQESPYGGVPLQPGTDPRHAHDPRVWQRGNIRRPPGWHPDYQAQYPFRDWVMDVVAWPVISDLQDHQKGLAVELVLGGTARDFVRQLPMQSRALGANYDMGDGRGPIQYNGLDFIVLVLTMHSAHLDEEESARQLMELWSFRRLPGENMDVYIARFQILHHRSMTSNQITLSPGQRCITLMQCHRMNHSFTTS